MKRSYTIVIMMIITTLSSLILHAKINQFGISDIIIPEKIGTAEKNEMIAQRIQEELGDNFTLQDLFDFLPKIQAYYDYLLNHHIDDHAAWHILKNALMDVKKAKMSHYLKANTVTPADEHYLRVELGKLDREINPIQ